MPRAAGLSTDADRLARAYVDAKLAAGLITLSVSSTLDGLPDAEALLQRSLASGNKILVIYATQWLLRARVLRARRTSDIDGLQEAVELRLDAAEALPRNAHSAKACALADVADGVLVLAQRAQADGDEELAETLIGEAAGHLDRAIALEPRQSPSRAELSIRTAWMRGRLGTCDLDAEIDRCRSALRRLAEWPVERKQAEYLALSDLLEIRAERQPSGATQDLVEAVQLCRAICDEGMPGSPAVARLPALLDRTAAPAGDIALAYRRAFDELGELAIGTAGRLAEEWAAWAAEQGWVSEAAEAHWRHIETVFRDARRRMTLRSQTRELAQVQGLTAQAGLWLLRAGRLREAAVALDLGRAVQMSARLHRAREDLAQRLDDIGQTALAERCRTLRDRLEDAERAEYVEPLRGATVTRVDLGDRTYDARFSSAQYGWLAEYEELLDEVAALAGFEDVAASPSFDDLLAAACEGPLAYVAATDEGGFAVIVTDSSPEPVRVWLPGLCRADVEQRAREIADINLLEPILAWLWSQLLSLLMPALQALAAPECDVVTLVPIGALGQLPIHSAGTTRGDDGEWYDATGGYVFRYAPNARVLARAQAIAGKVHLSDPQLLSVAVPNPDPHTLDELACAERESTDVRRLFGTSTPLQAPAPSVEDVLAALDKATIWHFACHAIHYPAQPLESCIVLAHGERLTLRLMFSRQTGRQRLAVLSACETAAVDPALLDEAVRPYGGRSVRPAV